MPKKIKVKKNPFTLGDYCEEDSDLLRERAKIYMGRHEWDRALKSLNRTLNQWGAKGISKYNPNDPPNKQANIIEEIREIGKKK